MAVLPVLRSARVRAHSLAACLAAVALLTTPATALVILGYDQDDFAGEMEFVGDLAYVIKGSLGLFIYDASDPMQLVELGSVPAPDGAQSFQVVGSLAYVTSAEGGLWIFDVSDPTAPFEVGFLDLPSRTIAVQVVGDLAYLACRSEGLRIADVSDPTAPVEIGVIKFSYGIWTEDVEIRGNFAYLANFTRGLAVVDISDPTAPSLVSQLDTSGWAWYLKVVGDIAYLSDTVDGLLVIDVSTPGAPAELGRVSLERAGSFEVVGDRLYVADERAGLVVLDVSDPLAPAQIGALSLGRARQLEVVGDIAYVTTDDAGLAVIDITRPSYPAEIGSIATPYDAYKVLVDQGIAYVADIHGVRIIDATDPSAPVEIASFGVGTHFVYALERVGDLLYLAGSPELTIVDVSDPAAPVEVGSPANSQSVTWDVEVDGGLAYLAAREAGYIIFDVSDPSAPVEVARVDTPARTDDVEIKDGYLYLADGWQGLRILDVSVPSAPIVVEDRIGTNVTSVELFGNLAFYSGGVIDITVPEAWEYRTWVGVCGISPGGLVGDLGYGTCSGGVQVSDDSDPLAPILLSGIATPGSNNDLGVEDGLVYVADRAEGLRILDFGGEILPPLEVAIDVRPWLRSNNIDPDSLWPIGVAIFGSDTLDVDDIDPASVRLGPPGAPMAEAIRHYTADFNWDQRPDLVLHYVQAQIGVQEGDEEACIEGALWNGRRLTGCDAIVVGRAGCGWGYEVALIAPPLFVLRASRSRRRRSR